jgi:AcrR family transcriptional regulator
MGSKERREREKLDTRDKILETARELFAAKGIEAVTMREIAKRIDYTPTAIYHHFKDKNALINELCALDFRALAHEMVKIAHVDDPIERLRRIGLAYVEFAINHASHYRFMFMTVKEPFEEPPLHIGNPEEDAYAFLKLTVTDAINRGRFRPELTDPDQVAQIMWAAVHGIVSIRIVKSEAKWIEFRDLHETAALIIDTIIRGALQES